LSPFNCCGDKCVWEASDTQNCGSCGHACSTGEFCSNGSCQQATCNTTNGCSLDDAGAPTTCCGAECCSPNSICCEVEAGPVYMGCFDATVGCPRGCPFCN
jgi:hypothetical protein